MSAESVLTNGQDQTALAGGQVQGNRASRQAAATYRTLV